jgi:hypothetical protein
VPDAKETISISEQADRLLEAPPGFFDMERSPIVRALDRWQDRSIARAFDKKQARLARLARELKQAERLEKTQAGEKLMRGLHRSPEEIQKMGGPGGWM